jgi:ComF family protein
MNNLITKLGEGLLQLIYPPVCSVCGKQLTSDSPVRNVCQQCLSSLQKVSADFIRGKILDRLSASYLDELYILFEFDNNLQEIIHQIKYRKMDRLAYHFGIYCQRYLPPQLFNREALVLPVPLHLSREKERGYNQSYHIAKGLFQDRLAPVERDLFIRRLNTKSQTTLDRQERHENVQNAFEIRQPEKILGKTVIIVDDVVTTGATINECARVLKEIGVKTAIGLALATPRGYIN